MDINQISTFEKHAGKSVTQIYSGAEKLPSPLLHANINIAISWFLPTDCINTIAVKDNRIRITGLPVQETKFINLAIRKSLNYYFSNDDDTWDCDKFDELNCPQPYRDFLSAQGDPCHIKWLIENHHDFYIPERELQQLELLPVFRFSKFHLTFITDGLLKFQPVMTSFYYRFDEKVRKMNREKALAANLAR